MDFNLIVTSKSFYARFHECTQYILGILIMKQVEHFLNIKNRFYSRQMKQFFTIYKNMPISKNYPVFSYLFLTWQKYIKQLEYTTLYFQNVLSLGSVTSNILPLTNIVFSKKLMHTYRLGFLLRFQPFTSTATLSQLIKHNFESGQASCYLLCGVIKVIYQIF